MSSETDIIIALENGFQLINEVAKCIIRYFSLLNRVSNKMLISLTGGNVKLYSKVSDVKIHLNAVCVARIDDKSLKKDI